MRLLIGILLSVFTSAAVAQQGTPFKKTDLIGAWAYIDSYSQWPSGRKEVLFGDKPQGIFVILANGLYSHIIMHPDLPVVRSGKFSDATVGEAERIAEGVLAHYGKWDADEKAGTFTVIIDRSSFPNINGAQQVRTVTKLDRQFLSYVNNLSVVDVSQSVRVVANLKRVW